MYECEALLFLTYVHVQLVIQKGVKLLYRLLCPSVRMSCGSDVSCLLGAKQTLQISLIVGRRFEMVPHHIFN